MRHRRFSPLSCCLSPGQALLFLVISLGFATAAFAADNPTPCSGNSEIRQFDYWLGNWTITHSGETGSGTSKVYLSLDKCLFVESWDNGKGHAGQNLFAYSPDDRSWHGFFADNQGHAHVFLSGKVTLGLAEFYGPSRGPNGETVLNRIRVVRLTQNSVDQTWDKSTDDGTTWKTVFQGKYDRTGP